METFASHSEWSALYESVYECWQLCEPQKQNILKWVLKDSYQDMTMWIAESFPEKIYKEITCVMHKVDVLSELPAL